MELLAHHLLLHHLRKALAGVYRSLPSYLQIANLKIAIYTRYWTWITYASFLGTSFLLYFAFLIGSNRLESSEVYMTSLVMLRHSHFYFIIFLCTGIVLTFDMIVFVSQQIFKKQRILPLMRFLKKPQYTLERRPSWADEMSIFDSFFKVPSDRLS